jgi:hypothetical protein
MGLLLTGPKDYHSLFYRLLSVRSSPELLGKDRELILLQWKSPRATAITYASVVLFIFAARYLNVLSYLLKGVYTALGG